MDLTAREPSEERSRERLQEGRGGDAAMAVGCPAEEEASEVGELWGKTFLSSSGLVAQIQGLESDKKKIGQGKPEGHISNHRFCI